MSNEIVGSDLIQPLVIGVRYYTSFKVVWVDNRRANYTYGANNKIGAKFISYSYTQPLNSNALIDNYAQIYTDSIVSDTTNWTQVFGSFVADSAYNQITIGGFFDNQFVSFNIVDSLGAHDYYFLDDICVSTDSLYCRSYAYPTDISKNVPISFEIFPNPVTDFFLVSNNSAVSKYSIEIYDALGQLVYTEANIDEKKKAISTSNLSSGVYTAVIKLSTYFFTYKILKQ
jgi:hypothetical protein